MTHAEITEKYAKFKVGDRVRFTAEEFTWGSGYDKKQDAWIGDTGVVEHVVTEHFDEEEQLVVFVVKLDEETMNRNPKNRWCRFVTGDKDTMRKLWC
jgi:uncharacterized OB-fold protein